MVCCSDEEVDQVSVESFMCGLSHGLVEECFRVGLEDSCCLLNDSGLQPKPRCSGEGLELSFFITLFSSCLSLRCLPEV